MTLDEYKAQQDKERAKVEFNIRKANEGTDWKKGYVLHKSKAEDVSETIVFELFVFHCFCFMRNVRFCYQPFSDVYVF